MSEEIKDPENEQQDPENEKQNPDEYVAIHEHKGDTYNYNPEKRKASIITDEEYIKTRVNNQREWYDQKASANQRRYKLYKKWEIILAASIPVVISFSAMGVVENTQIISEIVIENGVKKSVDLLTLSGIFQILAASAGILLVIITKVLELESYYKNWIEYRDMAEKIEREKMLYITRTEPYDELNAYPLFVEKIEGLLANEIQKWKQIPKAQIQTELLDKAQEAINKNLQSKMGK